jgi:nucleotide-binding universal stress UspA family protein
VLYPDLVMKNILALIDLSPLGERVVNYAATLAKGTGAKLWIIHVAAPEPDFVGFQTGPQHVRDHRAAALRHEHQYLQAMRDDLQALGVDAEAMLVQGSTVDTVFIEVERLHADMIAIGSRGHGGLYKALIGSVSEQVLTRSTIPVLVVPTPESDN